MTDVYLTIHNLISKGLNPASISKRLGYTKQRLNRYTTTLVKAGLIEKIGYGTWKTLKKYNEKLLKPFIKTHSKFFLKKTIKNHPILTENKIRGHAFIYKVKTNRLDIKNIKYILGKKGRFYELIRNKGIKTTIKKYKVHLWPKSIIIYDQRSYFSDKAYKCKKQAMSNALILIKFIENTLKIDLKGPDYDFSVVRSHYSRLNDPGAKHFMESGDKIQVKDKYGTWHIMDKSFNIDEAEFWKNKNPDKSQDIKDPDGYSKLINEHKELKWDMTPKKTLEMINGVVSNQIVFDKNMMSHIQAIKDLSKGVNELRAEIKKINGR